MLDLQVMLGLMILTYCADLITRDGVHRLAKVCAAVTVLVVVVMAAAGIGAFDGKP